jgi:Asp-tRNA(Asn)/Glu-tRNA(Gln) amidotransferase A subunit family amidase
MDTNDQVDRNEILEWTAQEALNRIRSGDITAESYAARLLSQYRATIDLTALSFINNEVLDSARSVDIARNAGKPLGPLAGLPVVVKDNISTVGFPTTAGTPGLKGYLPPRNARVTQILFDKGAILLGKANMHELGRGVTNSNRAFGCTENPYDKTLVPGGGAGGTAAAIAARITPAGLGSDTAGSARMPAAFCGIAGFRPTTAGSSESWTLGGWTVSTSHDGIFPIAYALTTPAPMGRTVSDVALLHAAVTRDSEHKEILLPKAIPLKNVRIGVPRGFYWDDLDPEVLRVSEIALEKLRDAGAILIDVDLRQWANVANTTFFTVAYMNNLQDMKDFLVTNVPNVSLDQLMSQVASIDVQRRLQHALANPITAEQAEVAMKTRIMLARQYEDMFRRSNLEAILYPTAPALPPAIRRDNNGNGNDSMTDTIDLNGQQVDEFNTLLRNTHLSGVVGIPSLSIPAGASSSGLPVGLSLSGVATGDDNVLGLALSIETVFGRTPPPPLTYAP